MPARPTRLVIAVVLAVVLGGQILALPHPVVAQAKGGTVQGTVFLDEDGNGRRTANAPGIGGVTVTISNGRWSGRTVTDGDGAFRFNDLLEAAYNVRVEPPDAYRRTTEAAVAARVSGNANVTVNFGLAKLGAAARSAATATPVPTATPSAGQRTSREVGLATATPDRRDGPSSSAPAGTPSPGEVQPRRALVPEDAVRAIGSPTAASPGPRTPAEQGVFAGAPLVGSPTARQPQPQAVSQGTAPRFGTLAEGRTRPGLPTWSRSEPPIAASKLDEFLRAKNSPLAGHGEALLDAGWRYNVDPRLLVAIAGAETTFGRALCTDMNAWNWFWFEWCNSPFESWKQGLDEVARGLRMYYLDGGRTDVDSIAERYCPINDPRDVNGVNGLWPGAVTHFLEELGGSRCNLSWVRTDGGCVGQRSAPTRPAATPAPNRAPPLVRAPLPPVDLNGGLPQADRTPIIIRGGQAAAAIDLERAPASIQPGRAPSPSAADWPPTAQREQGPVGARPGSTDDAGPAGSASLGQIGSVGLGGLQRPAADDATRAAAAGEASSGAQGSAGAARDGGILEAADLHPLDRPLPVRPHPMDELGPLAAYIPITATPTPTTADPAATQAGPELGEVQIRGVEAIRIGQALPGQLLAAVALLLLADGLGAVRVFGWPPSMLMAGRMLRWRRGRKSARAPRLPDASGLPDPGGL